MTDSLNISINLTNRIPLLYESTNKESLGDYLINRHNEASFQIVFITFAFAIITMFLIGYRYKIPTKWRFIIDLVIIILMHTIIFGQVILYFLMTDNLIKIIPIASQFFAVLFIATIGYKNYQTLMFWKK